MIIQTRYRDVPWTEVSADFRHGHKRKYGPTNWNQRRGKRCRIVGPPLQLKHRVLACNGPFYRIVKKDGSPILNNGIPCSVCPHIAEIGD